MNTELITQLILNGLERRSSEFDKTHGNIMSPVQVMRELQTAKIRFPRRHGHTSAAINILQRVPNSLLITATQLLKQHIQNSWTGKDPTIMDRILVVPPYPAYVEDVIQSHALGQKGLDIVMIDPTSIYERTESGEQTLAEIKRLFSTHTKLIVELG